MLTKVRTVLRLRAQAGRIPQVGAQQPHAAVADHVQTEYLPILDGLRGVAIILVMLFHFELLWSGWIGVQIFFVLSGFLITTILMKSKDLPAGQYFKRFYWRRTVRIMPVYILYSGIMLAIYFATGFPHQLDRWLVGIGTYTLNWQRAFSDATITRQINHTVGHFWSLGVEEQFYIFWPILLYSMPKNVFKRFLVAAVVANLLLKSAFYLYMHSTGYPVESLDPLFRFSTLSHIEPFLFGALIACYPGVFQKKSGLIYVLIIQFTVVAFYNSIHFNLGRFNGFPAMYTIEYGYIWYYSVINLFAAAILMACLQSRTWLRWLHNPAMRFIGRISYGMYIYHYILCYLFLDKMPYRSIHSLPGYQMVLMFCIYLGLVIGVSTISFHFFERFFLKFKYRFG
jgi:peptidoglycan/LPS O-acetylase OafA/YrhL